MARFDFEEPAADGHAAVTVSVRNPDAVSVALIQEGDEMVTLSYWQLERITQRVQKAFAFQLDREQGNGQ